MNSSEFPQPVRIPVNGVELEVFEAGQHNAGNPIVLCHGWPDHARTWRYLVPALVAEGYHVIVPNQRGYGNSSRPAEVEGYDIVHLTGDLVALLDHYGYQHATFVGHDWGAFVTWGMALLHPARVKRVIALSLPYQVRGETPWIEWMEAALGGDFYFVHFNRQPGVADAMFDANAARFLGNLYRKNQPAPADLVSLAMEEVPLGDPIMSEDELDALVSAFETSGFTGGINWYRNLDRNWNLLAAADPIIRQPALMIYGERDAIRPDPRLADFVPGVEVVTLDSGHWIQQELPEETNGAIVEWLQRQDAAALS